MSSSATPFPTKPEPSAKQMPLTLQPLLPLRSIVVTLRFLEPASIDFFHQVPLSAYLRSLLGSPKDYEHFCMVDAPEGGRIHYKAGDLYRFQISFLNGGELLLKRLLTALYELPQSALEAGIVSKRPFGANMVLESVLDSFTHYSIEKWHECSEYDNQMLTEEALSWQGVQTVNLNWLSRVRLSLGKGNKVKSGEARYCHDNEQVSAELLLSRLYDAARQLLQLRGDGVASRQQLPDVKTVNSHLFWLDYHYGGGKDKPVKPLGGLSGQMQLQLDNGFDLSWWRLLILGQYLGIGQGRVFGLGRYQLMTSKLGFSYRRAFAASSLIDRVSDPDNLASALSHVRKNSSLSQDLQPDTDELLPESLALSAYDPPSDIENDDGQIALLQAQFNKVVQGHYSTPQLNGWVIEKKNGGQRPLAVPPFLDRVMQRACAQILTPCFEKVMNPSSHGYRPGRSRLTAKDEINYWVRKGYTWVYESDLKDFFESVDHRHLEVRLRALYGNDPLVMQLLNWMAADVRFMGEMIKREKGLPQGSPLSPLLANLMLDDFDHDMQTRGFKLVRFADDFVVLCKSPEQARRASRYATQTLAEHGLKLNQDKTHIKPIGHGVQYLGYLFVGDLVLDLSGSEYNDGTALVKGETTIQPGWLANISQHKQHKIAENTSAKTLETIATPSTETIKAVGECDSTGEIVCVSGAMSVLSTQQGRLVIKRDDECIFSAPWRNLQAVTLFGLQHITTPALKAAMSNSVPVHFADTMGRYQGVAWNGRAELGHQMWLAQQKAFLDQEASLAAAKSVVCAKISHQCSVLRNRRIAVPASMKAVNTRVTAAEDFQALNGYEGAAAAAYFKAIAGDLDPKWQFDNRNRRPPTDPLNVLLSLGYSLLHGYVDSLAKTQGLLPTQGFYHQSHGTHSALASDLMEPFRYWVDGVALRMLNKNQLSVDDFVLSSDGCQIDKAARNKFLAELALSFETPRRVVGIDEPKRLTDMIIIQNQRAIDWVREKGEFEAIRLL
ncbi:CRISPR-associated endonuclease Cas1 [Vibrio sp. WXL210]|uniref:CRISPR-associated endonuclease Cas1 n=1 Tax=Vibrio sp. WXL210 TaxID=3450709 RepID=UPI003EC597B7